MSLYSLTHRFSLTLSRKTSTQTNTGGVTIAYTTAARGSRPTSVYGDMQTMTSEERIEYGINGERIAWCMYTASDPKLSTEDQVVWTDNSSVTRTCDVIRPSFDMAGRSRIWLTVVEERENQT